MRSVSKGERTPSNGKALIRSGSRFDPWKGEYQVRDYLRL
jgi:hypothetical protein